MECRLGKLSHTERPIELEERPIELEERPDSLLAGSGGSQISTAGE